MTQRGTCPKCGPRVLTIPTRDTLVSGRVCASCGMRTH